MKLGKWGVRIISFVSILLLGSCATIVSGPKQKVKFTTKNVSGADIYINGINTGQKTPATILVKKKVKKKDQGVGFVKNSQTYTLKKEGYLDFTYTDVAKNRGVPLLGNIIFGGVIGVVVDVTNKSPLKFSKQISGSLIEMYDPSKEPVIKPIAKNNWETYKNKVYSIEYPKSWSPSTENKKEQVMISTYIEETNTELVVALMPINKQIYGDDFPTYFNNTVENYKRIPSNQIISVSSDSNEGKVTYINSDNVRGILYCKKNEGVVVNYIVVSEEKHYRAYADTLDAIMNSLNVHATDVELGDISALANVRQNTTSSTSAKIVVSNKREKEKQKFDQLYSFETNSESKNATIKLSNETLSLPNSKKIKKVAEDFPNLKYRRSSLYTLMINDASRNNHDVIRDAFGDEVIPNKFNDHNVGPYLIDGNGGLKDQTATINSFIHTNDLAKKMVAKWFNRSASGGFNMNLVADRGQYDASEMDIKIAKSSQRGIALLSDAGEELIGNTFLVVNDYRYTNKEEVAAKAGKVISIIGAVTGQEDIANLVAAGVGAAGKGYIIKSTSYLYKLEWNDSIAAVFYNDYWTDESNLDQTKVAAFDNSDLFKLKLVGVQNAFADVQSSVFTDKSDKDLIGMATIKATDKATAKLQREYPTFQTKTPLTSVDPLSAKIGLKEGVEPRDKFEVLEQTIDKNGKTKYVRKAIITVDKKQIWDNSEMEGSTGRTIFKGKSTGLYPGMLIRQIR